MTDTAHMPSSHPAEPDSGSEQAAIHRDLRPTGRQEERKWLADTWMTEEERRHALSRETLLPLAVAIADTCVWFGLITVALLPLPLWISLGLGFPIALAIGMMFVIGHDACHQSLTPSRRLNLWVGRLTFLPSMHAVSLWVVGHNQIHHGNTNLRGSDYVWEPMSPEDWAQASVLRRMMYRIYRGPVGTLPYYLIEMWAKKNFVPIAPETRKDWRHHLPDSAFVVLGNVVLIGIVLVWGSWLAPERSAWATLLVGWAWPFLLFNAVMGWTIYVHHTHPEVRWYGTRAEWSLVKSSLDSTLQVNYVTPLDQISNAIMEHNAHHALPGIPFYRLRGAQAMLRERIAGIRTSLLTPPTFFALTRACKLYDYKAHQWTDFKGRPTGPRLADPAPASTSEKDG